MEINDFINPQYQHIIDKLGKPDEILVETPYSFSWFINNIVPGSAEDFMFRRERPEGWIIQKVGNFGTDHKYFGIWKELIS